MALTVNNLSTLSLLNVLNRTSTAQEGVLQRMATGKMINRGSDNPAALLALTQVDSELTAIDAGITNNQRTDAMLGIADNALSEIGNLVDEVQRLASETANDAALTAEEITANQAQIDDALASIDRIAGTVNFNGKKLIDGSLAIQAEAATANKVSDIRVFSRKSGSTDTTLAVKLNTAATGASATSVMAAAAAAGQGSFQVQGALGTAVISYVTGETIASVTSKINGTSGQTGLSAVASSNVLYVYSKALGSDAFVRTKAIEGADINDKSDVGVDAVASVNGQKAAVDGNHVSYAGDGISLSFDINGLAAGGSVNLTVKGDSTGKSGATFNLGTNSTSRATIGIDGVYSAQLGNKTDGYLKSLASGGSNSLLKNPNQAATIARAAAQQISTVQGRIGGFQKFQVRTAINSLNNNKEGLEKVQSVINDVDYAVESAELNRQNVLLQSSISLLGLANQQSTQVLSLLR